jgi:hypothetical protein
VQEVAVSRTLQTLGIALILAGVLGGAAASAHHSFATYYFEDQSVTLQGTVTEFNFRNPHTLLHFTAKDAAGAEHTYVAEWGNPGRLQQSGVSRDSVKPGDVVVVTGSPGRVESEYKLHLKRIQRPADGWTWGQGNGRGGRGFGRR